MAMNAELLHLIERKTGMSIDQLQAGTISERRSEVEAKFRKPMRLLRLFPFIGRGSVMGEFLLSHADVNKQLNRALR
ncbi:hypothetical protein [Fluviibacter phosphoraccumulans]|uniref:Uncharacterized protein n=1 Tax=Fluviibacter phosphoraccumulans TaxID=1751046 RepID=A0A679I6M5_9RHOO|nr:hypothetical protein [Fluviibacter phosphoraccumulans]BBU68001.1 hypothetical protein ICHIAU1_02840 [Fluviibacter phosphoraccumulans]BBU70460.1 hypothetical protein ICHIJ1_03790 [Fluviibacter phosphoraccumulans]BCA66190.1 hypothetical protein SHINM1_017920 [Fluviibacter phosphoraccumulans]